MHIRRAHENEALTLSALAVEAKSLWAYSAVDIERWRSQISLSRAEIQLNPTFVAEIDERIVGFYSLVEEPESWKLDHLWVTPSAMRRGLGRALLAHAVSTARAGGATVIAIDADPNAEPFYVACGARRCGSIAAPIGGNPTRVRPQLVLSLVRS